MDYFQRHNKKIVERCQNMWSWWLINNSLNNSALFFFKCNCYIGKFRCSTILLKPHVFQIKISHIVVLDCYEYRLNKMLSYSIINQINICLYVQWLYFSALCSSTRSRYSNISTIRLIFLSVGRLFDCKYCLIICKYFD